MHPEGMGIHLNCLYGCIHRRQCTKHHQSNVAGFFLPRARTCSVMKHRRIYVAEGDARSNDRNVRMPAGAVMRSQTYQAKLPMNATNLSKSLAPVQLMTVQSATMEKRNTFFCHLTRRSSFPLRVNSPFSMILTAGKSCRGVDNKIAMEYRNCTYRVIGSLSGCTIINSRSTHDLYHLAPGVEVHNNDRLDLISKGQISQCTGTSE